MIIKRKRNTYADFAWSWNTNDVFKCHGIYNGNRHDRAECYSSLLAIRLPTRLSNDTIENIA